MLDFRAANDRAVRYAIKTGELPNLHIIQALQRQEGYEPCFGRAVGQCSQTQCRWHEACMALAEFQPPSRLHGPDQQPRQKAPRVLQTASMRLELYGPAVMLGIPPAAKKAECAAAAAE